MAMPAPFEGLHKETAKMDRRRVIAFAWQAILDLKLVLCINNVETVQIYSFRGPCVSSCLSRKVWSPWFVGKKFIASEDHACLVVIVEKSDHHGLWARNCCRSHWKYRRILHKNNVDKNKASSFFFFFKLTKVSRIVCTIKLTII